MTTYERILTLSVIRWANTFFRHTCFGGIVIKYGIYVQPGNALVANNTLSSGSNLYGHGVLYGSSLLSSILLFCCSIIIYDRYNFSLHAIK